MAIRRSSAFVPRRSAVASAIGLMGVALVACTRGELATTPGGPCTSGRDQFAVADGNNGDARVYVAAHGRTKRRDLTGGGTDASPSMSPDGKDIAVARSQEPGAYESDGPESQEIYVVDTAGKEAHGITTGRFDAEPAWSPDGEWIAYTHLDLGSANVRSTYGLRVVHPDGSGTRTLTSQTDGPVGLAWSPDGGTIAFLSGFGREHRFVRVVRVATGQVRTIATMTGFGGNVAWSPDGRSLLVEERGLTSIDLRSKRRRIISRTASNPAWSQDGKRLYVTIPDAENGDVLRVHQGRIVDGRLVLDFTFAESIEPYSYLGITVGPCLRTV